MTERWLDGAINIYRPFLVYEDGDDLCREPRILEDRNFDDSKMKQPSYVLINLSKCRFRKFKNSYT